jgi:hypothetical protein
MALSKAGLEKHLETVRNRSLESGPALEELYEHHLPGLGKILKKSRIPNEDKTHLVKLGIFAAAKITDTTAHFQEVLPEFVKKALLEHHDLLPLREPQVITARKEKRLDEIRERWEHDAELNHPDVSVLTTKQLVQFWKIKQVASKIGARNLRPETIAAYKRLRSKENRR